MQHYKKSFALYLRQKLITQCRLSRTGDLLFIFRYSILLYNGIATSSTWCKFKITRCLTLIVLMVLTHKLNQGEMNISTIGTNTAIKITIQYSTFSAPQYLQSKLYDL
jgi:hypothetical protein